MSKNLRYSNELKVAESTNSLNYTKSVLPKSIPINTVPFFYVSKFGDRFDTISQLFYKTPNNWWVIAKANNLVNGGVGIEPGTKLYIPNL